MSTTRKQDTSTALPKIPGLHYEFEPLRSEEYPLEPELASRVRYARAKKVVLTVIVVAGFLIAAILLDGVLSK